MGTTAVCRRVAGTALAIAAFLPPCAHAGQPASTLGTRLEQALAEITPAKAGEAENARLLIWRDVKRAGPVRRQALEQALIRTLRDPKATHDCRQFACLALLRIATREAVPVLGSLLSDEAVSPLALNGLARLPFDEVDEVLIEAIARLDGDARATAVRTLGLRKTAEAVPALAQLLTGKDEELTKTCLAALGRIGTAKAGTALAEWRPSAGVRQQWAAALLACSNTLLDAGAAPQAAALCARLTVEDVPRELRVAARRVILLAESGASTDTVLALLRQQDDELRDVAADIAESLPGTEATSALADALGSLDARARRALTKSLAARRDPVARPAVAALLDDPDATVRTAAVRAMAVLGDASVVARLAALTTAGGDVAEAATETLQTLKGPDVAGAIRQAIETTGPRTQAVLARVVAKRGDAGAAPVLLRLAGGADPTLRQAALRALKELAGEKDAPALVSLLAESSDTTSADLAADAFLSSVGPGTATDELRDLLRATFPKASPAAKATVLRLLGHVADDEALPLLVESLASPDSALRDAALAALVAWPNARPLEGLLTFVHTSDDAALRRDALRGCTRMAAFAAALSDQERNELYDSVQAAARTEEEKALVKAAREALQIGEVRVKTGKKVEVVVGGMEPGALVYIDRAYTFVKVPEPLVGATYIKMAMEDKYAKDDDYFTMTVSKPVTVYVSFDNRAKALPAWLQGWEKTGHALATTDRSCRPNVYARTFPAGVVSLGGNSSPGAGAHYDVAVRE